MYILHSRQGLLWAPACPHVVITQAHVCPCLASSAVRRVFVHSPAAGLMGFETYSSFQASLSLKNQPGLHPGKNRNVTSEKHCPPAPGWLLHSPRGGIGRNLVVCGHSCDTEAATKFCSAELLNPGLLLAPLQSKSLLLRFFPVLRSWQKETTSVLRKVPVAVLSWVCSNLISQVESTGFQM